MVYPRTFYCLLLIILLSLTGCKPAQISKALQELKAGEKLAGEAAELAAKKAGKKVDEVPSADWHASNSTGAFNAEWLGTYLSVRVPITVVRALARQKKAKGEYQLFPSRLTYTGSISTEAGEFPAYLMMHTEKKCEWSVDTELAAFGEGEDGLVRIKNNDALVESFNGVVAIERTYTEIAIVPSYDAKDGKIVSRETEQYGVKKTKNGVQVDFQKPEVRSAIGYGDILLTVESDQFMLDMMKQGRNLYSYMLFSADSPQLYTREELFVTQFPESNVFDGMRLWRRNRESYEPLDGGWQKPTKSVEILDSLGIALYFEIDTSDGGKIRSHLEEVEFSEPETCPNG